jgi:NAD(P)H-hydrate repair Nnr-like enzyme with NAD(P)H-hydrate epimerase domain
MLPLLIAEQIRQADAYTIANEPVASIDLMERASKAFVGWFTNRFPDKNEPVQAIMAVTGLPLRVFYVIIIIKSFTL